MEQPQDLPGMPHAVRGELEGDHAVDGPAVGFAEVDQPGHQYLLRNLDRRVPLERQGDHVRFVAVGADRFEEARRDQLGAAATNGICAVAMTMRIEVSPSRPECGVSLTLLEPTQANAEQGELSACILFRGARAAQLGLESLARSSAARTRDEPRDPAITASSARTVVSTARAVRIPFHLRAAKK